MTNIDTDNTFWSRVLRALTHVQGALFVLAPIGPAAWHIVRNGRSRGEKR
jgi:hypothetical protein